MPVAMAVKVTLLPTPDGLACRLETLKAGSVSIVRLAGALETTPARLVAARMYSYPVHAGGDSRASAAKPWWRRNKDYRWPRR